MKKIFTLATLLLSAALTAGATDYTAPIRVTVGGESVDAGQTTISVDDTNDSEWSLTLRNFTFSGMPVGNISLTGIPVTKCGTVSTFAQHIADAAITNGDDADVDSWMGPELGKMPIDIKGRVAKNDIQAVLLINMCHAGLGTIRVEVGERADEVTQLPNSGFERFHTAKSGSTTSDEPDGWHSFMSCQGSLASAVKGTVHTAIVTDGLREGTTGTRALKVYSSAILSISANGTVTTGRLNAGSMTAANTDNHSLLDFTLTDTDAAGDPFYAVLTTRPDSITAWVKYTVGKRSSKNQNNVYATISSAITDGTYYQDPNPSGANYTNVVAKASNTEVAATDDWQRVTIPFDYATYEANGASARALLVTMSTCSVPGGGSTTSSDPDILLVDDVALVYNTALTALSYDGQAVSGFSADTDEYEIESATAFDKEKLAWTLPSQASTVDIVEVKTDDAHSTVFLTVKGDDLSARTYTLSFTDTTAAGIDAIDAPSSEPVSAVYDLSGRRVSQTAQGNVYIVRTQSGKAYKMVR